MSILDSKGNNQANDRSRLKVIQWGAGYVGTQSLRYILESTELELVVVRCHSDDKVGKTAGELCGLSATGPKATQDSAALIALDADCVVYMPRDPLGDPSLPDAASAIWYREIIEILRSGKNIVTPLAAGIHPGHLADGQGFAAGIEQACQDGRSSILFTGFEPGFTDMLACVMSSAVGGVHAVRTWEIVDYESYTAVDTLRGMGFGMPPEASQAMVGVLHTMFGGMPYLIGEALGLPIDGSRVNVEPWIAPETYQAPGGLEVVKGSVGAIRFQVAGYHGDVDVVSVNHVNRIGQHMAPEWPYIGRDGGYRVEIDGFPPFVGEFPMGGPGGTGTTFGDAMAMTAGRSVNAVPFVVAAAPGYRTHIDLPTASGHATARR